MNTITIQFEDSKGKIREKTFASQEAMEKWLAKNDVKVLRFSR